MRVLGSTTATNVDVVLVTVTFGRGGLIFTLNIARASVHLSVCLSVTRVDRSETVEVRIIQFSPYTSPIPLIFAG